MKKLLILVLIVIFSTLSYAALPPSGILAVSYEGNDMPDEEFYVEYLICKEAEYESHKAVIDELDINEYDPEKDCHWKLPKWEYRWNRCMKSKCDTFSIPYSNALKVALFIPSLDRLFITNTISTDAGKNYYDVSLLADESAQISKTDHIDEREMYDGFEEDPPVSESDYLLGGGLILIIILFIGLTVWLILRKAKPKKK